VLSIGIGGVRVGPEVVIERYVLLEDHNDVLDRRCSPGLASIAVVAVMEIACACRAGE